MRTPPLSPLRTAFLLSAVMGCAEKPLVVAAPTLSSADPAAHTAVNPAATFNAYRTFAFGPVEGPPVGYASSGRSPEVARRLAPLIATALENRGYVQADAAHADLLVMFGSGRREIAVHESSDDQTGWVPDDENADFVEGSLVIDAFEASGHRKVWHGASRANIDPDRIDDALLRKSVDRLMVSFPWAAQVQ